MTVFNSYYIGLLRNLYAGPDGAVMRGMQYRYQASVLVFNSKLSEKLYQFANEELEEEKKLASLIVQSGGDPVFANSENRFFNGRKIDYIKDIKQIMLQNIENIEKSILDYKITELKIDNKLLKKELNIIAENKKEQLNNLKTLFDFI